MSANESIADSDQGKSWISVTINGTKQEYLVEQRLSLADFIRNQVGLKGTHLGCEHGSCGACTVILDNRAVRSCLMFAAQSDGSSIETVEGLAEDGVLSPLQESFRANHALQCGFCTSGFLMSLVARLREGPIDTEAEAREALSGNICRCTGYSGMVAAVLGLSNSNLGLKENS
jgi:aerobic-type carbon monoxide dehydrogenase small subunit (CoxS/CutS family)